MARFLALPEDQKRFHRLPEFKYLTASAHSGSISWLGKAAKTWNLLRGIVQRPLWGLRFLWRYWLLKTTGRLLRKEGVNQLVCYDIGARWTEPESIKFDAFIHGAGVQIGFKTPIGLARFAIGENFRFAKSATKPLLLNNPIFYFSIGANL